MCVIDGFQYFFRIQKSGRRNTAACEKSLLCDGKCGYSAVNLFDNRFCCKLGWNGSHNAIKSIFMYKTIHHIQIIWMEQIIVIQQDYIFPSGESCRPQCIPIDTYILLIPVIHNPAIRQFPDQLKCIVFHGRLIIVVCHHNFKVCYHFLI